MKYNPITPTHHPSPWPSLVRPVLVGALALMWVACQGGKQKTGTEVPAQAADTSSVIVSAEPLDVQAAAGGIQTLILADGVKVTWINDNAEAHRHPVSLFPDATEAMVQELGLADGLESTVSTFLVETGGVRVLFDTGLGKEGSQLIPRLQTLGLSPDSISYIYLTHYHGDHIGGLMCGDSPAFVHAQVYAPRVEHEAWMGMPADKNAMQVKVLGAYADRLHLFEYGDSLPGDIVPIAAVGHTPGHTAFRVGKLLIIGDLIHGAALQIPYPEVCARYDMDKENAIEARKRLLQYAHDNGLVMAGMHLPAPAFIGPQCENR